MVAAEDRRSNTNYPKGLGIVSANNRYGHARDRKRNVGNGEIEATHTREVRARDRYTYAHFIGAGYEPFEHHRRIAATRELARSLARPLARSRSRGPPRAHKYLIFILNGKTNDGSMPRFPTPH